MLQLATAVNNMLRKKVASMIVDLIVKFLHNINSFRLEQLWFTFQN